VPDRPRLRNCPQQREVMNFLQKPFTPTALADMVREVLDGG
jgi:hypothetical protein